MDKPKSNRGFAALSPEQRREIAAKGGSSVPPASRSFSQDRKLASAAGRKGGAAPHPKPKPRAEPDA